MKKEIILLIAIAILLLVGLAVRFHVRQAVPLSETMGTTIAVNPPQMPTNVTGVPDSLNGAPVNVVTPAATPRQAMEKISNPSSWPDDARPEVKELYQFAKVARLYNFDPTVTGFRQSPSFLNQIDVGTPTHSIEIDTLNARLRFLHSYLDESHSDLRNPEVKQQWIHCVGAWNEQAMIDETIRILRELGYTEFMDLAKNGKFQFKAFEFQTTMPDGQRVTLYPFAVVTLLDASGSRRIYAEYRMGTDGQPAGLVRWVAY